MVNIMAMAPKLQLKQGQSLVMTPQLQQAIKLLQLSNIELSAFVEDQLESNPLLERGTGDENRRGENNTDTVGGDDALGSAASVDSMSLEAPAAQMPEMDAPAHAIDTEATVGEQRAADVGGSVDWSKAGTGGTFNGSGEYDAAANTAAEKSLAEHLGEQLSHLSISDTDRLIARHLIDHVDEMGYLRADIHDISENLGVSPARVQSLLTQLQSFEPTGVFARNLQECLALQLREKDALDVAMQALLDNLELLAKHDLTKLMKLCEVDKEELLMRVKRLKSLAPKPGLAFGGEMAAAIEPDVFVRETPQGGWAVELNSDTLPRVLVDKRYYNEICAVATDAASKEFMSECHANANWLVKSLDQRARTILKVSSEIIKQQDGFFAFGIDHLRPLNLKTVAEAIEMHESTVSRVTSNKFMSTPRGVFELKYFFTASIPSIEGGEGHSAEAVRHKIKILISEETAETVKSDDKLVNLLRAQGIDIARRTVAKYRESMGIPSSVERRRIFKHSV